VSYSLDAARPLQPPDGPTLPWPWLLAAAAGGALAWGAPSDPEAARRRRGVVLALAATAATWWVVALGPYLRWEGTIYFLPLPFQTLYQYVPFFSRLHWPARTLPYLWIAVVLLALPVLRHLALRGRGVVVMLVVAALLPAAAQGLWPLPATPLRVPAFYRNFSQVQAGGVIEASLPWNSSVAGTLQAWHGQKVLGNLAQHPPYFGDADPMLRDPRNYDANAFLRAVDKARQGTLAVDGAAAAVDALRTAGYRWITVHRALPHASTVEQALRAILDRPPDVVENGFAAWEIQSGGR
jgi:hypothetical protein